MATYPDNLNQYNSNFNLDNFKQIIQSTIVTLRLDESFKRNNRYLHEFVTDPNLNNTQFKLLVVYQISGQSCYTFKLLDINASRVEKIDDNTYIYHNPTDRNKYITFSCNTGEGEGEEKEVSCYLHETETCLLCYLFDNVDKFNGFYLRISNLEKCKDNIYTMLARLVEDPIHFEWRLKVYLNEYLNMFRGVIENAFRYLNPLI